MCECEAECVCICSLTRSRMPLYISLIVSVSCILWCERECTLLLSFFLQRYALIARWSWRLCECVVHITVNSLRSGVFSSSGLLVWNGQLKLSSLLTSLALLIVASKIYSNWTASVSWSDLSLRSANFLKYYGCAAPLPPLTYARFCIAVQLPLCNRVCERVYTMIISS